MMPLTSEDKRNQKIGRNIYTNGWPQPNLNFHQRAGWLQAAAANPDSFINKTDAQLRAEDHARKSHSKKVREEIKLSAKQREEARVRAKAKVEAEKKSKLKGKGGRPLGSKNKNKYIRKKSKLKESMEELVEEQQEQIKAVQCNGCFNPFKPNRMQIKKSSYFCRACSSKKVYG